LKCAAPRGPYASCFHVAVLPPTVQYQSRPDASTKRSPRAPAVGWVVAAEGVRRSWARCPAKTPPRPPLLLPTTPGPLPALLPLTPAVETLVVLPWTPSPPALLKP